MSSEHLKLKVYFKISVMASVSLLNCRDQKQSNSNSVSYESLGTRIVYLFKREKTEGFIVKLQIQFRATALLCNLLHPRLIGMWFSTEVNGHKAETSEFCYYWHFRLSPSFTFNQIKSKACQSASSSHRVETSSSENEWLELWSVSGKLQLARRR